MKKFLKAVLAFAMLLSLGLFVSNTVDSVTGVNDDPEFLPLENE